MNEFRIAVRSLAGRPALTAIAVLTLAAGVGVSTALFSVVNSTLLEPLSYEGSDRIVSVQSTEVGTGRLSSRITGPDVLALRDAAGLFEALSLHRGGEIGVKVGGKTEFARVALVNPGFFRVFAVEPIRGRWFESEDENSAVVSAAFAQRHFGSMDAAIGATLALDETTYEIRAIAPASLQYPRKPEVLVPSKWPRTTESATALSYSIVGRLAPGISLRSAEEQLRALLLQGDRRRSLVPIPLRDFVVGTSRPTLQLLMGAVMMILLLCCANIAHLMLARGAGRSREIAVRAALGAGRWRIARGLMAESAVIGICGGVFGLLLARVLLDGVLAMAPAALPRLDEIKLDRNAVSFVVAVSLASCIVFGLLPAWRAAATDVNRALKRGASSATSTTRLRGAIVIAEIAMCFVLTAGTGLLLRSFLSSINADLGFQPQSVLVMYAHAPARSLQDHVDAGRRLEEIANGMTTIPGVISASAAMGVPAGLYSAQGGFAVEGKHQYHRGAALPTAGYRLTSPGYFRTMGIPLLRGREFDSRDVYKHPLVAVISNVLARQEFPGEDPIGKRIRCGLAEKHWITVVGVAGDVRHQSPQATPASEIYMPVRQHPFYSNELQLVVRTQGDPAALQGVLKSKAQALDPRVAVKIATLTSMLSDSLAVPRFRTTLLTLFAGLALLLAMVGVYGVMSHTVAARAPEFGLRVAIGANPMRICRDVLERTLRLTVAGLTIGIALAFGLSRVMAMSMAGIKSLDLATFAGAAACVAIASVAASLGPAIRASRVDPLSALRQE